MKGYVKYDIHYLAPYNFDHRYAQYAEYSFVMYDLATRNAYVAKSKQQ